MQEIGGDEIEDCAVDNRAKNGDAEEGVHRGHDAHINLIKPSAKPVGEKEQRSEHLHDKLSSEEEQDGI